MQVVDGHQGPQTHSLLQHSTLRSQPRQNYRYLAFSSQADFEASLAVFTDSAWSREFTRTHDACSLAVVVRCHDDSQCCWLLSQMALAVPACLIHPTNHKRSVRLVVLAWRVMRDYLVGSLRGLSSQAIGEVVATVGCHRMVMRIASTRELISEQWI